MTPPPVLITKEETAMVARLAREAFSTYCKNSIHDLEDLFQSGMVGLLDAKSRFQPERGIRFSTFARKRVWGAIMDVIRKQTTVSMSQQRRQRAKELEIAIKDLRREGLSPSPTELTEKLGWSIEQIFQTAEDSLAIVPISQTDWREEEDNAPKVILQDDADGQEFHLLRRELAELVNKCLEELPSDLDRIVLRGRYQEDLKLKELASTMGCSEQAVHQRQKKAEQWMKECIGTCNWEG